MKKILSFIVVLLLTIVFISNVKAKSSELEVTNVEILEKSDEVKANIEEYKDLNIDLNTLFFSKDDYVKYKITIKNNTKNTMKIDDILDNFNSEVLETSYDIEKKELKSNEEYKFTLTIKCIKDITEEKVTITSPLNIIINYDNGKTATIDINPNTKDSIINYFIIFVLSAISLFLVITKKGKKQLLGLMLIVSLIPITSNAVSTSKTLIINNDIKVYGKTAVFKTGIEVNKQLKELAGTDTSVNQNTSNVVDTNITEIKRANKLPDGFIPNDENTISTDESRIPIYAWFDNGIIYYYTEANNPLLNEASEGLFMNLINVTKIELETIDTNDVENMRAMFYNCNSVSNLNLDSFNTQNVTDMGWMFWSCKKLENLNLISFDTSNVINMKTMFSTCEQLEELNISNFDTSKVTDMSYMFNKCYLLKALDLSSFDTHNVTTMVSMFQCCENLKELNLSNFDTSKVTDMSYMFNYCQKLKQLDLSFFDTSNVTNMGAMFQRCENLEQLNISNFDTANVTSMAWMFNRCYLLKALDLSSFDTHNVTTMVSMFQLCQNLEELDISNFDTSKVTDMSYMFNNCYLLKALDLSNFDTSKVTDMSYMFAKCTSLEELDVSKWDTSSVTLMRAMFCGNSYVGDMKIKYLDVSKWDVSNVTDMTLMLKK